MSNDAISVVVITRNRREEVMRTLGQLVALPEKPVVIVVDNDSNDGTADAIRAQFPMVRCVPLDHNQGAVARNVGVQLATTPYVAFADDDSWWAPGALRLAVCALESHPRLGLVTGAVRVGASGRLDDVSQRMAAAPLGREPDLPGPNVLGFLACAAVVRRSAYLGVGGFHRLIFFGAEESLLAIDLAAAGWGLVYLPGAVAHHLPSPVRETPAARRLVGLRNDVIICWMRRRPGLAMWATAQLMVRMSDPVARKALLGVLRRLPAALHRRHEVPPWLERQLVVLGEPSSLVG